MKLALATVLAAGCHSGVSTDPHKTGTDIDSGYTPPSCTPISVQPATAGTCADAEGPIAPYACAADLNAMIIGKWRHCSGRLLVDVGEAGIELDADFNYYALVDDGAGHLVRKTGFDYQGTWDSYQETEHAVQFDIHPTPNSGLGGFPVFENNPRRFAVKMHYDTVAAVYVYEGP